MKPMKLAAAVLATALAVCTPAAAQEQYPSRLITVVVPLTPGTTIDILARLFAESLSKRFGQQVIVANRPGAGGLIAAQAVASAPAEIGRASCRERVLSRVSRGTEQRE